MPSEFTDLLQKVRNEQEKRGLSLEILAKQTRLRVEFLNELWKIETSENSENPQLNLNQVRQVYKLAEYLKVDFDKKQWLKDYQNLSISNSKLRLKPQTRIEKVKNIIYVFTFQNLNLIIVGLITVSVLSLIALPIFLVVRPAEITWMDSDITNNTIEVSVARRKITGLTYRAKNLTFGGQVVALQNGYFSLDLPKPNQEVIVPLVLNNYFNFTTEYQIVIKPSN